MKHNWKHIKFGDAFNLQMGKTPARANSAYWSNGLYDWVSISDMPNGKYIQGTKEKISQKAVDETGIHLVKKGTALMSFKLTIGKTAIAPYDLYTNEAIMAFEPKDGTDVLADFLYYYLQLYEWDGNRAVMGNTTNKGVISNSYAYIPSLSEQESIVAELDGINHLIDLQEEQLREYDRLAQSLFYTTFGDPVSNPKGWEVKLIGEIGNVERGAGISKKDFVPSGSPCIHYGQLHTVFGPYTTRHISCIPNDLIAKPRIAHPNDVVMAITSEDVEGSCKSTAWMGDYDVIVGSDAAILHHSQNGVYVSYYTQTKAFYIEKEKYANGFKVTHISAKDIESIPIMCPPLSLQQSFAVQIEAIEQQKALIRRSLDETRTLLAARMQYYFE